MSIDKAQKALCLLFDVSPQRPSSEQTLGIAIDTLGTPPLNGLRHPVENGTCGWYIWGGGEIPQDDIEFFQALHVSHIEVLCPEAGKFLALPPGWRFLVGNPEDEVWFDESLLD